jgi:glycosyltransferase involved in cell wall biosynthesis
MALRIGFDATAAARQSAGIGRYTRQLLAAFNARTDRNRYQVYYCGGGVMQGHLPALDTRFRVRKLPVSDRLLNAVWYRARLPLPVQFITGNIDLFHSPDFALPPTLNAPGVLTIHDLAFLRQPECAYPTLRRYLEQVVPRSVRRASRIIAVSDSTRWDLIELLDVNPARVTTIHEGVSPEYQRADDPERVWSQLKVHGIREPFILAVGTLEPRKNYARLLEAYAMLRQRGMPQRLVIAGALGWLYEPIYEQLHKLQLEQSVTIVRPDDEMLLALYQSADTFICASLYEGFGIPLLEALACGTPVACSNSSSMPEVVGDAALLFDPLDSEQISQAIWRCLSETEMNAELRTRGPARAALFPWKKTAAETINVYTEVASCG